MQVTMCLKFCFKQIYYFDVIKMKDKIMMLHISLCRPCGMLGFLTYSTNIAALRDTALFVLMHSGIVNGHQLLCDAHTVLEPHMGTAALFLFHSLSSFSTFSFMCLSP